MVLMNNSLSIARSRHAGSGTIAEMMFAGSSASGDSNSVEKIRYDDQVPSVSLTNLSQGRNSLCSESNILDKCLFLGGAPGPIDSIESLHFDDSAQAIYSNTLSQAKFGTASAAGY